MPVETNTLAPAPTWDTTTTPGPTAAPPTPNHTPETPPSKGRGWLGWLIAALLIAGLVFVKMKYFPSNAAGDKKGGAAGGPGGGAKGGGGPGGKGSGQRLPVQVYVVAATNLDNEVAATGSVLPEESVVIKSELSGKITALNIREGQSVSKGQPAVQHQRRRGPGGHPQAGIQHQALPRPGAPPAHAARQGVHQRAGIRAVQQPACSRPRPTCRPCAPRWPRLTCGHRFPACSA
ncbi:biotin/lipoyl-binding protein [Hymenobacter humi]|uniref:Biotin/lipoyl-binding protein n=1 Tax=Hymenobacter humi TaxID=1411620 RepID=A0ABW2UAM1_9BACT